MVTWRVALFSRTCSVASQYGEGRANCAVVLAAFFGEHQVAALAQGQRLLQKAFQQVQLMADGGGRHVQLAGGGIHSAVAGKRFEGAHGTQRRVIG